MKKVNLFLFILLNISSLSYGQLKDSRYYEMRIYYSPEGKLPDLLNRFRNHTTKIFERHGMTNIGYWTPINNTQNAIYYILAYPSKEARDASWKAFGDDPEWKRVSSASEANGRIVARAESIFMHTTDFSPTATPQNIGNRVFELRIYTSPAGKAANLRERFRRHTMKLFKKHGMENIVYFQTIEKEGVEPRLLYLLAHESEAAGKASFESFGKDPKWNRVRTKSIKNGEIVEKVESIYMVPTDFSPIK